MNLQDRELLELAAKAAGVRGEWCEFTIAATGKVLTGIGNPMVFCPGDPLWNPLTDDGDALRLAVKIGMRVSVNRDPAGFTAIASTQSPFGAKSETESAGAETIESATRRAIVRAAAEIARSM